MENLDTTVTEILNAEMMHVSISDMKLIANSLYRLGFKNFGYCRFSIFLMDLSKFLMKYYPTPDQVFENVSKHSVENMGRSMQIFTLINNRADIQTFRQIYEACDTFGYNIGLILSSFIEYK